MGESRAAVCGPSRTGIPNEGTSRMKRSFLGASAAIALFAAPASADPAISYVPNSLAESVIKHGPWTLHESVATFMHECFGHRPNCKQP
jgi:hypothetical protein